jgi:hypothetical protein
MKKVSQLFLLLITPIFLLAPNKQVLFIGNSYTGVNNLPTLTKDLALSLQDTLIIDSNTPGGTTFNSHTNNTTSLSKIGQGTWDYVILQAQSQEPSFSPSQVAVQTYPYAKILVDSILSANECTIPLFYMTWGRKNGDASNCTSYPVICTYDGMQGRLRESYLEMAIDNEAEVSPVGAAWKYVRDNHPTIELYSADESHPSAAGSYLAACVHYTSIYKKSPVGASFTFSLSTGDAAILQNAAKLIVMDSLENWNFTDREAISNFTSISTTGSEFQFTNTSQNATDYQWNFGDGTTSTLENPNHTYSTTGFYTVTLISSNNCNADTSTHQVEVFSNQLTKQNPNLFSFDVVNDQIIVSFENNTSAIIRLYNISGQVIEQKQSNKPVVELLKPQTKGIYFLSVTPLNGSDRITKKVMIE